MEEAIIKASILLLPIVLKMKSNDGIIMCLLDRSNLSLDNFDGHCPAMIEEVEESAMEEAAKMSKLEVSFNLSVQNAHKFHFSLCMCVCGGGCVEGCMCLFCFTLVF